MAEKVEFILQADDQASGQIKNVENSFQSVQATAAQAGLAFGAIGAAGGLMIKTWMDQAGEAATAQNQLTAAIASTKGVSGETVQSVNDLAEAMQNKTSIDKESILAADNMLLTFTQIHKETFPAATEAALNMATAMGGGVEPSAEKLRETSIQLGKALNDPVKGITALHRVGVEFTDAQKEQIATMVKANDIAGAQAVILNELGTEFGGSAAKLNEGLGGAMRRFNNDVRDLNESLGKALGPTFQKIMDYVDQLVKWFKNLDEPTKDLIAKTTLVVTVFAMVAAAVLGVIAALNPVTIAVVAITAAVGALYVAWETNFGGIKDLTTKIAQWISDHWTQIQQFTTDTWNAILAFFKDTLNKIWMAVGPVINDLWNTFQDWWAKIQQLWDKYGGTITALFKAWLAVLKVAWDAFWVAFSTIFQAAWAYFKGIISVALDLLNGDWKAAWNDMNTALGGIWDAINKNLGGYIAGILKQLSKWGEDVLNWMNDKFGKPLEQAWNAIWTWLANAVGPIISGIQNTIDALIKSIQWILDAPGKLAGAAVSIASSASSFVGNLVSGHKAEGGPVNSGESYLVGEQGPEIITMGGNGFVTPNHALGGGNTTIVLNMNGPISDKQVAMQYAEIMFNKFKLSAAAF